MLKKTISSPPRGRSNSMPAKPKVTIRKHLTDSLNRTRAVSENSSSLVLNTWMQESINTPICKDPLATNKKK